MRERVSSHKKNKLEGLAPECPHCTLSLLPNSLFPCNRHSSTPSCPPPPPPPPPAGVLHCWLSIAGLLICPPCRPSSLSACLHTCHISGACRRLSSTLNPTPHPPQPPTPPPPHLSLAQSLSLIYEFPVFLSSSQCDCICVITARARARACVCVCVCVCVCFSKTVEQVFHFRP